MSQGARNMVWMQCHDYYQCRPMSIDRDGHFEDQHDLRGRAAAGPAGIGDHHSSVDAVTCAHAGARTSLLRRADASVVEHARGERVIGVIDHAPDRFDGLSADASRWEHVAAAENVHQDGLSGARHAGSECTQSGVVALLDHAACADVGWLRPVRRAPADSGVAGTGGRVAPDSDDADEPAWLPRDFRWTVGCCCRRSAGAAAGEVRTPIGVDVPFRRGAVTVGRGLRLGLGWMGTVPAGGEKTEATIRVRAHGRGSRTADHLDARLRRYVPRYRATSSTTRDRCRVESRPTTPVAALVGADVRLSSGRGSVLRGVRSGVLRADRDAACGGRAGWYRSGAMLGRVSRTAVGYLAGRRRARLIGLPHERLGVSLRAAATLLVSHVVHRVRRMTPPGLSVVACRRCWRGHS